jgi:membrane protease YdiL (CAAX protease family)
MKQERTGLHWYALALVWPAAYAFVTGTLQQLLGATLKPLPGPVHLVVLMGLVGSILRGIVNGEELGWRGYALPRLQERYPALRASLILGVIWFAFHVPIMFIPGSIAGSQTFDDALPFLVGVLAMSVIITWIFNATRGSVLPIILLHGAYNSWPDLFAMTGGSDLSAARGDRGAQLAKQRPARRPFLSESPVLCCATRRHYSTSQQQVRHVA